jgi:hypothetical protein
MVLKTKLNGKTGMQAARHLAVAAMLFSAIAAQPVRAQSAPDFPAKDWQMVSPESEGYSSKKLEALRAWLAAGPTTAMVIVVHGHMIFSYGDTAKVSKIASVRKSILSMLYGKVPGGQNHRPGQDRRRTRAWLSRTSRSADREDGDALSAALRPIRNLPAARRGPPDKDLIAASQPRRGSEPPGMYFHYNDWDFNAAGDAFEKLTGKNIYDALQSDLAQPIQMQDFDRAKQAKITHPGESHPEYAMYLSTRDMARLGLLMLRNGNWNGKQVIPENWVQGSTGVWTPFEEMNPPYLRALGAPERWGFGLMWWVWDAHPYAWRPVFPALSRGLRGARDGRPVHYRAAGKRHGPGPQGLHRCVPAARDQPGRMGHDHEHGYLGGVFGAVQVGTGRSQSGQLRQPGSFARVSDVPD